MKFLDTGTHVVMGIALCSLATLDNNIFITDATTTAVFCGIMFGSQAPDIDTLLKLKSNAAYISNHRGITHSISAQLIFPIVIALILKLVLYDAQFFSIWFWSQIAISFHIFVDLFNAYGTQAFRPFSKKWVALGVINTFDPIIFILHIIGIFFVTIGFHAGMTFFYIYLILAIYYVIRIVYHLILKTIIKNNYKDAHNIVLIPTMRFFKFKFAFEDNDFFYVGEIHRFHLIVLDKFTHRLMPSDEIMLVAKCDHNIQAFLSFSPIYRWELTQLANQIDLRFIDLRYRKDNYYPFVAVITLDSNLNKLNSYTGWIFSEKKLQKKLIIT